MNPLIKIGMTSLIIGSVASAIVSSLYHKETVKELHARCSENSRIIDPNSAESLIWTVTDGYVVPCPEDSYVPIVCVNLGSESYGVYDDRTFPIGEIVDVLIGFDYVHTEDIYKMVALKIAE